MISGKFHLYTRITVALVAAILVSEFLVQDVFLGATPAVRPDVADRLVERTLAFVNIDNYTAFFRRDRNRSSDIASMPFSTTVVRGVYAKENETTSVVQVKVDEVDWIEVPYTRNDGTVIQLRIPRGTNPPPPGLF